MSAALAGILGPLGLPELIIILVIVLLLFGSTKIPQIMRGMGPVSYTHLTLPTILRV